MKNLNSKKNVISRLATMLLALALVLTTVLPMAEVSSYAVAGPAGAAQTGNTKTVSEQKAGTQDTAKQESGKTAAAPANEKNSAPAATSISNYQTAYDKNYSKTLIIEADITPAADREVQLQRYSTEDNTWTTIKTLSGNGRAVTYSESSGDQGSDVNEYADSKTGKVTGSASKSGRKTVGAADADTNAAADGAADTDTTADADGAANTDTTADADGTEAETVTDTMTVSRDKSVVHVGIVVPQEECAKTTSVWRLYVPATETAAAAHSSNIVVTTRNLEDLALSARSACVYRVDGDGKGVLIYSKQADKKLPQASTTKLMTAVLLLENGLLNSTTKISTHAARTPWGSGRLAAGDVYNTEDLLYAMMLPSSNDAATAIAEKVGGSETAFVSMMNAKAEALGFTRTHFRNPHGLDADGHYTTALELAKLTAYAYNFPEIRECWATKYRTIKSLKRGRRWTLWSTNSLFKYVSNFLGGKTGTEDNAKCCFTGMYTYEGSTYVTVVLGSGYGYARWSDTKKLHKYIQDYAATKY